RPQRPSARGDGERRRSLHPLRPVRDSMSDRRDDDGAIHDHGAAMSDTHPMARRDFIFRVGTGAGIAAIAYQAGASMRSLVPNVSWDAPATVTPAPPADFPDGLKFLPDERLFVFREGATFHAISAVCTHLGCTARAEALPQPETRQVGGKSLRLTHRFQCP